MDTFSLRNDSLLSNSRKYEKESHVAYMQLEADNNLLYLACNPHGDIHIKEMYLSVAVNYTSL